LFAIEDEYSCERATLELDDGAAADPDSTSESESLSMFIKSTKSHGNISSWLARNTLGDMSVTVHGEAVVVASEVGVVELPTSGSRESTKRSEVGDVTTESRARVSALADAMMSDRDDVRQCTRALCG